MQDPANMPLEVLCHDGAMKPVHTLIGEPYGGDFGDATTCWLEIGASVFLEDRKQNYSQESTVYQFHNI